MAVAHPIGVRVTGGVFTYAHVQSVDSIVAVVVDARPLDVVLDQVAVGVVDFWIGLVVDNSRKVAIPTPVPVEVLVAVVHVVKVRVRIHRIGGGGRIGILNEHQHVGICVALGEAELGSVLHAVAIGVRVQRQQAEPTVDFGAVGQAVVIGVGVVGIREIDVDLIRVRDPVAVAIVEHKRIGHAVSDGGRAGLILVTPREVHGQRLGAARGACHDANRSIEQTNAVKRSQQDPEVEKIVLGPIEAGVRLGDEGVAVGPKGDRQRIRRYRRLRLVRRVADTSKSGVLRKLELVVVADTAHQE